MYSRLRNALSTRKCTAHPIRYLVEEAKKMHWQRTHVLKWTDEGLSESK